MHALLGNLSLAAVQNGPIVYLADAFMIVVVLVVLGLLFYFHGWKWLWKNWLTTTNPKRIGVMYMILGVVMFIRAAIDASMMRAQQAMASGGSFGYLPAHHFDQVFTAHGTMMIFFAAMPLMFGFFNIITPMQIGSRDVAFPFLNSISFWMTTAGAILVLLSLPIGEFAATGWLAYPPLSEIAYSPSVGVDYWIWAILLSGIGSTLSAVNFIATIFKCRAPGMKLMRMPIFTWTVLATSMMVLFAVPVLTGAVSMLYLDRLFSFHFFTSGFGGNLMMYVNLVWAFGHPEVYILVLPAFGIWSEIVSTFSRKRLFGYTSMVWATFGIAIVSFTVWLHHFFTMGAGPDVNSIFGIMTMIIAIPTGVKFFNWIFTMFRGRVRFTAPMYWFMAFVFTFILGGMTGVLLAIPPVDFQLHNSLFLIAHFHTMIVGGVIFGYFAGIMYWFPKVFGVKLHEGWGKAAAILWVVGFWVAFGPLYALGLMGATRRVNHFAASLHFQPLFVIAGFGVVIIAAGLLCQIIQVIVSIRRKKQEKYMDTNGDPWDGRTLEWSIPSPAPEYLFWKVPRVHDIDAFWDHKYGQKLDYGPREYEDITVPKNTPFGFILGIVGAVFGFAMIWHIWWLSVLMFVGGIAILIWWSFQYERERVIPADEVRRIEDSYVH